MTNFRYSDGKTYFFKSRSAQIQVLQKQTDYYSHNPNADRIVQVQGEIDEVKKVMVENIGMQCVCGDICC